eukprot:gene5074-187_t
MPRAGRAMQKNAVIPYRSKPVSVNSHNTTWAHQASIPSTSSPKWITSSTINVIESFLRKQGMDSDGWSNIGVKDLDLPAYKVNSYAERARHCFTSATKRIVPKEGNVLAGMAFIQDLLTREDNYDGSQQRTALSPCSAVNETNIISSNQDSLSAATVCIRNLRKESLVQREFLTVPTHDVTVRALTRSRSPALMPVRATKTRSARLTSQGTQSESMQGFSFEAVVESFSDGETCQRVTQKTSSVNCDSSLGVPDGESCNGVEPHTSDTTFKCDNKSRKGVLLKAKKIYPYIENTEKYKEMNKKLSFFTDVYRMTNRLGEKDKRKIDAAHRKVLEDAYTNVKFSPISGSYKYLVNQMKYKKMVKKFYKYVDTSNLTGSFLNKNHVNIN